MIFRTLKRQQTLPAPVEEVFSFFQAPENLARITPPSLNFHILTPSPVAMREGAIIDYTIRVAGFPVRWTTMITRYDPPFRFVDQQLRGPYSFWHHTHTFTGHEGRTIMEDEILYLMPMGVFGDLMHGMFVERRLNRIFDYRAESIAQMFSPPATRRRAVRREELYK